ncbi:lac operon transcriptional repressor [Klebsiella pneumoniae]|nr:lac operon transcriptional repressor [Klebsiella pneumoniae]SWU40396.1 lac operon transcriptional repressor [Klebsiella pneumoniae]SWX13644.1 lac operon transcriptional repressor [Klebsiella pneumoniae]SWX84384.1 lac operon transcriptional repressor [Klebsiella pneumoniae]SWY54079.1 lac operon transcriptional repressor [Klebsiella pneumoniae]
MPRRTATLEDVARAAGVSQQTVSRVLNRPEVVSARTREQVIRAMQALHYVPNRSAQLLAGKAAPSIGLITASLTLHAPSQIAAAIKSHASLHQLEVAIAMPAQADFVALQARLDELRAQHIRGVIVSLPLESATAERLVQDNPDMACLFLDVSPEADVCCVRFDHRDGCGACVRHLWELGHREFGLLAGPESSVSARLRLASWREALHSLNIARSTTVFGDWSAASGWQKTFELLHLQPRISAIVVANDQMALGVLSALAQLNRSGSRAVSVTGYDDTADSLYFQPPLTTVAQDFDLLGKRAVERLIALMAAPQLRIRELLPTRLIVRQSAWPVAAAEDRQQTLAQLKALVEKLWLLVVEALLKLSMLTSAANVER